MEVWNALSSNHEALRSIALAGAAFVGLPFLIWRTIIANKQSTAALRQARTSEDNHVSDMFSKAIEQLAAEKEDGKPILAQRIGALYSLEQVANNNTQYYDQIMEVLCAYIRLESPVLPRQEDTNYEYDGPPRSETLRFEGSPREDVHIALTIVGRCLPAHKKKRVLNLTETHLVNASLYKANLSGANFTRASLAGAKVAGGDLSEIIFWGADLEFIDITECDLSKADMRCASVSEATIERSVLSEVDLSHSRLRSTIIRQTILRKSDLTSAQMQSAFLQNVDLNEAELKQVDLSYAKLENTELNDTLRDRGIVDNATQDGASLDQYG